MADPNRAEEVAGETEEGVATKPDYRWRIQDGEQPPKADGKSGWSDFTGKVNTGIGLVDDRNPRD